jgi:hypothetical protein
MRLTAWCEQQLVAMSTTYFWVPTLTKLSVLVLIHQVYNAKWGKICTWILGSAIVIYTIVLTVLVTGPCHPIHGSVVCLTRAGTGHAGLNIISDLLVIALPVPLVHQLQMPMRQKISVGVLMTLGSFCVVASIIRTAFIADIQNNPDITYCQARVGVCSAIELNVGILGASCKPFPIICSGKNLMKQQWLVSNLSFKNTSRPSRRLSCRPERSPNTEDRAAYSKTASYGRAATATSCIASKGAAYNPPMDRCPMEESMSSRISTLRSLKMFQRNGSVAIKAGCPDEALADLWTDGESRANTSIHPEAPINSSPLYSIAHHISMEYSVKRYSSKPLATLGVIHPGRPSQYLPNRSYPIPSNCPRKT